MFDREKMKGRTVPLMITLFIFLVTFACLHGCFAEHAEAQPPWQRTTVHPTAVTGYESSVLFPLSGNVYPYGHYTATIMMGSPAMPFELAIDTGSVLTWVQCDAPCEGCTLPPDRLYDPANDDSLPCSDPLCALLGANDPDNYCVDEHCIINVNYADGSSVDADVGVNIFTVQLVNGTLLAPLMTFGCGFSMVDPGPSAGILALGRSEGMISSLWSQMGIMQDIIGLCLNAQGGFLFLGADFVPLSGLSWMPMLENGLFYSAGPVELLFGGNPTGVNGFDIVFDSGATYTYLSSEIYQTVLDLVRRNLNGTPLQEVNNRGLPVCWKGVTPFNSLQDVSNYFNTFALNFTDASDVQLELPPEAYLLVTEQGNYVCLGILDSSTEGQLRTNNVIGDISMLNKVVIFDNENQMIGWASADCSLVPPWF